VIRAFAYIVNVTISFGARAASGSFSPTGDRKKRLVARSVSSDDPSVPPSPAFVVARHRHDISFDISRSRQRIAEPRGCP